MDDLDDAAIKAQLDDIGKTIDNIISRVKSFETELNLSDTEDDNT